MSDTLICPKCHERLWVAQMQIPLLTCPRCLGVIINPNAAAGKPLTPVPQQRRVEPLQVIPLEEDVGYDLRGTVGGMAVLAIILLASGLASIFLLHERLLSIVLIGAAMMTVGGVWSSNARVKRQEQRFAAEPTRWPELDYHQARSEVSAFAFMGGFIIAIVIGIICFYVLESTGSRATAQYRRTVFAGVMLIIVGLIIGTINLRRVPGWTGFGRGVAIGLALAMMALGPCAACYMLTLFG